ncbi:MAG: NADPH-dependent FMN reductase [Bdellovibrionota bacterium]
MATILIVSGSLRKDSLNTKLAHVWAASFAKNGTEVEVVAADLLNVPLINQDIEIPPSIKSLSDKIQLAKGVIICTPEYNGGISPVIKNAIDWTSTLRPHPWAGKPVFLSGTSPGALGAVSALLHTRNPLDRLGAHVFPQSYGIPHGDKELTGKTLEDPKKQEMLDSLAERFLGFCSKF